MTVVHYDGDCQGVRTEPGEECSTCSNVFLEEVDLESVLTTLVVPTCGIIYACAGHWTLASQQAGFDVRFHNALSEEHNEILQDNFPDILMEEEQVDFIFGSPPCLGYSSMVAKKNRDSTHNNNLRTKTLDFITKALKLAKQGILMEITRNIKQFKEIDELKRVITSAGWKLSVMEINTADFGGAQKRKRLYFAITRNGTAPILTTKPHTDAYALVETVDNPGYYYTPIPGEKGPFREYELGRAPRRMTNPCGAVSEIFGRIYLHPTEDRLIGTREAQVLMGFPLDYKLPHTELHDFRYIGGGVDIRATAEILGQFRRQI